MADGICYHDDCARPIYARLICAWHYAWHRKNDPNWHNVLVRGHDAERFWSRVQKSDGCWLWTGNISQYGYGRFYAAGHEGPAHRWAYENVVGPIPDGLHLDHLCRVRNCVRPTHLEPVTCRTNILRGIAPPAQNHLATHCKHGHELTEANTYIRPNGNRSCRTCLRYRSWKHRGSPEPRTIDHPPTLDCPICGSPFKAKLGPRGRQKTCSFSCGQTLRYQGVQHGD